MKHLVLIMALMATPVVAQEQTVEQKFGVCKVISDMVYRFGEERDNKTPKEEIVAYINESIPESYNELLLRWLDSVYAYGEISKERFWANSVTNCIMVAM